MSHGLVALLALLSILLMVGPTAGTWTPASGGSPGVATAPASSNSTAPVVASAPAANASGSIPGQSPVGEPYVDAAALAAADARQPGSAAVLASVENSSVSGSPSPTGTVSAGVHAATHATSTAANASSQAYGWIQGTVVAAGPAATPLSGALVAAEPVSGFCPPAGCTEVQTGATGSFTVQASIGENEVLVSDGYYLSNRTWTYVSTNSYVNVGTIALVADGIVTGVVRGDDPANEPVAGVEVTSLSLDGAVVGSPTTHTNALGQFTVAVPPIPSEIDFTPLNVYSPYQSNLTFVNVSSGASLDIGTVLLERTTVVSVSIFDSVTGLAIDSPAAVQICSRITAYCTPQTTLNSSGTLIGYAPVGPDTAVLYAVGYVVDSVVLGNVPATPGGSNPVSMGSYRLVPLGGITVWANITGVATPYGDSLPTSEWEVGEYAVVSACSLDGLDDGVVTPAFNMSEADCTEVCIPPGAEGQFAALPLRNYVHVEPDEIGCITPGYPTWPIPGDLPVFDNYAWVNVTPDRLTNAGGIDLLPGTYIEGTVLPESASGWDVEACSTDEPSECGEGSSADVGYYGQYTYFVPNGCPEYPDPSADYTYCVAAPPGPVEIRVTPTNASANYTWAYNPPLTWNSVPLPLSQADQDYSDSIQLVGASVRGEVLQSLSFTPVLGLPSIQVCPAGVTPSAVVCGGTVSNSTGSYFVNAPIGWDVVTVSAPDYESNSTWVYVNASGVANAGVVLLVPYAYVEGEVLDSQGDGIYEATVDLCPASQPDSCTPVGSDGLTSTDGFYYGAAAAGPTPVGAYEVKASASGYVTDWTWVNVTTPGENFTAPALVLQPVASSSGGSAPASDRLAPAGSAAATAVPLAGSWVTGRVIDAADGIGLPTSAITASPTTGATPTVFSSIRGTGGEFNESVPDGSYWLNVTEPGFYPTSVLLNVSGNESVLSIGALRLTPYPTVTGQLVIDPAAWTFGVTYTYGLGPGQGAVTICTDVGTDCAPAGIVSTDGVFNASAPVGDYDFVLATGTGTGQGTYANGFVSARSIVNVTAGSVSSTIPTPIGLAIYGILTGSIVNANSTSSANRPVRYDEVTADSTYPVDATESEVVTADGTYAIVFPESNGLNMTAGGLGAWIPVGVGITVNGTTQGGTGNYLLTAGGTVTLSPISLEHFGYVDLEVVSAPGGAEVPYATVAASEPGTLWNLPTSFSANGVANGAGFLNLSLPPSIPTYRSHVTLIVSAPDFGTTEVNISVNASRTTYVNGSSALSLGGLSLKSYPWIFGSVKDRLTGRPLGDASVAISVAGTAVGKPGVTTNGLGDFVALGAPSDALNVTISLGGYSTNLTTYDATYGETLTPPTILLTGDGIVSGRVIAEPGGQPVAGATVSVCPVQTPYCSSSVTSNVSGDFWVEAAPGRSLVTLAAPGFVTNSSAYVNVISDSWIGVGSLAVQRYAYVVGTVLGLPSGLPLSGATVGVCAPTPSGVGAGGCVVTIVTQSDGTFDIPVAAGVYVLNASADDYNATYLPIALSSGETLPVGLVFVEAYGTVTGDLWGADSAAAPSGATLTACEEWGARSCSAPTPVRSSGQFVVNEPAGPILLEAAADGYQTSYQTVWLAAGVTLTLPAWYLQPTGPGVHYLVSGHVAAGSLSGPGLSGAVVGTAGGPSTPTDASGNFSLLIAWGSYVLTASAPGYVPESVDVSVVQPLDGVDFALQPMTYAISGITTAGLSGAALGSVTIREDGVTLAVSASDGAFDFRLGNGTHELVATAPAADGLTALGLTVTVTGAALTVPIALYPATVSVNGVVVNALNGLAVPSATVTLTGTTDQGTSWSITVSSGPGGRFFASAYPGAYTAYALGSGFQEVESALVVGPNATAVPLTLSLMPLSTSASSGPSMSADAWVVGALIAAAAVTGIVVWIGARSRPPRAGSRAPTPPDQENAP